MADVRHLTSAEYDMMFCLGHAQFELVIKATAESAAVIGVNTDRGVAVLPDGSGLTFDLPAETFAADFRLLQTRPAQFLFDFISEPAGQGLLMISQALDRAKRALGGNTTSADADLVARLVSLASDCTPFFERAAKTCLANKRQWETKPSDSEPAGEPWQLDCSAVSKN